MKKTFWCLPPLILFLFIQSVNAQTNLLINGGFETGEVSPWIDITDSQITSVEKYSGNYAIHLNQAAEGSQRWIDVEIGKTYVYTGWFKWNEFSGTDWGYDRFVVIGDDWQSLGGINNLHNKHERGKWNKLAVTFTPNTNRVGVIFGVDGPKENVDMYFDNFMLFEKTENLPPNINPTSDISSGEVPLKVQFFGNGNDADGSIKYWHWDFGDGSYEIKEDPTHIFYQRGTYTITVKAWDNDNEMVSDTLTVNVQDNISPVVTIVSPTNQEIYKTTSSSVILSGDANSPSNTISRIVWDNINSGESGSIDLTSSQSLNWNSGEILLKPGKNEILITCTDSEGRVDTDVIYVHREVSGPTVSGITVPSIEVKVYEKFEFTFDLETVAEYKLFKYDEDPPLGVEPGIGVTVEGIFETPSGEVLVQPGFYYTVVEREVSGDWVTYIETNKEHWAVRFSPQEVGEHQVSLRVQDASGTVIVPVGSFHADPPDKKGFIQVSQDDSRYFEFSNGDLFWPIGPAHGQDYTEYKGTGQNLERPWMGGSGAYSTNWARWVSSGLTGGNEGYMAILNFWKHYPSHELSKKISYPKYTNIWMGFCDTCGSNPTFKGELKADTDYLVKVRLKTVNITGPQDPSYPHGFMIKKHGWPSDWEQLNQYLRSYPSFISPVNKNLPWHTVVNVYHTTQRDANEQYFGLFLDNVDSGSVYIDEFSMREILPDGSLGGEVIRNPKADMHTYVEQRPAAFFDWQVEQCEQNDVFLKYVIQDKNDWIPSHLVDIGIFYTPGNGYYQPGGTKARWLLEQWWRYLAARWGYSTAVHSWELCNEGDPSSSSHYQMTDDFGSFMHEIDSHPHMVTTSNWHSFPADQFWGNSNYPNVDYSDIHKYSGDDPLGYDVAAFVNETSVGLYRTSVGKPIIRGETGLGIPWGEPGTLGKKVFDYLNQPNSGVWYHNLIWSGLNYGGMLEFNYWWGSHWDPINREEISRPFYLFVKDLDINKGSYVDINPVVSNSNIRVFGQKNTNSGKAHAWIQNRYHTWRNVMGVENPHSISPESGTITISDMPSGNYRVDWWDTYNGQLHLTEYVQANSDLVLTLPHPLEDDIAVKIENTDIVPTTTVQLTTSTTVQTTTVQPTTITTTTVPVDTSPEWYNLIIEWIEDALRITVDWWDNSQLQAVIISENSTGEWVNHTVYSSEETTLTKTTSIVD